METEIFPMCTRQDYLPWNAAQKKHQIAVNVTADRGHFQFAQPVLLCRANGRDPIVRQSERDTNPLKIIVDRWLFLKTRERKISVLERTSPINMQKSCTTSVYATAYSPPNMVYETAMRADTTTDRVSLKPTITVIVAPAQEKVISIYLYRKI